MAELLENFTENKKRGRPPDLALASLRANYPGISVRTMQNSGYFVTAYDALKDKTEYAWLLEGSGGKMKRITILYELGRFGDEKRIVLMAKYICEQKPKVRDGVNMLRSIRMELNGNPRQTKGDPDKLSDEMLTVIDDFLSRYPKTDTQAILDALQSVYDVVRGYGQPV